MPRAKKSPSKPIDYEKIPLILRELESLLEAFDEEDPEDIGYRLDALTTMFLKARFVSQKRTRRLKFHIAIEELVLDLPNRDKLSERMETFEDLTNAYGDEASDEEFDEAKEILVEVIRDLKAAFQRVAKKN